MVLRGLELCVKRIGSIILLRDAATTMLTNHPRCIFKPDCFIVWLIYDYFVHFPSGTDAVSTSLVHTFALNPGVMWEPASHRSGWFGRLRPLTRGDGPPSLTFESRPIR